MKCPRCEQENPPQAKFCLECSTPLALRCANCGTQLPAGAKFCFECAMPVSTPASPPRFTSPETYTSKHLAKQIINSNAALEGERKQVTVLFADLKGSMELLADRDPEEARKILDPVLAHMMEAVHRYEGTVNQVMGDGIMALFGAPLAHEDHAVRACYAALRMQAAVRRYSEEARRAHGVDVQIRAGLNSGEVVVRSIMGDLRMDYTAVGQTTHLAARMEQLAQPGTVVITSAVMRLVNGYLDARPLGQQYVKGLLSPVEAYELIGPGSVRVRFEASTARGLTLFVGSETTLERMVGVLSRVRSGSGHVLAVVGDAGVGKSRLFYEFVHRHVPPDWLIFHSHAVSYGTSTPYLPIIDLLKRRFGIDGRATVDTFEERVRVGLAELDESLLSHLTPLLNVLSVPTRNPEWDVLDGAHRRERIHIALKALVLRAAMQQPLLLMFEDLHWADEATLDALEQLVDSVPAARILLLVNYRPEYELRWSAKSYFSLLRLNPLSEDMASRLFDAITGHSDSLEDLRQAVIEQTQGNPFFIEESVKHLVDTGAITGEPGDYSVVHALSRVAVPPTVQAVLSARIDRLPPQDKHILQAAAAIGRDVPAELLRAVAKVTNEQFQAAMRRLQTAELMYESRLFPEPQYTFKHSLTHDVAYGSLLRLQQRGLHAMIVEESERLYSNLNDHAESLARHAIAAEEWGKGIDYLRMAATKAYATGNLTRRITYLEEALALNGSLSGSPDDIGRAIDICLDLYAPLYMTGQIARLVTLLEEAKQLGEESQDRRRLALVSSRMAALAFTRAQYDEGIRLAQAAIDIATDINDRECRIFAMNFLGFQHEARGDYDRAIEVFRHSTDGPDAEYARQRFRDLQAAPYVYACGWIAACAAQQGRFDYALSYGARAVEAVRDFQNSPTSVVAHLANAFALGLAGQFAEGVRCAHHALEVAERSRLLGFLFYGYSVYGWLLGGLGRTQEAVEFVVRGTDLHELLGVKTRLALFHTWRARLLIIQGHVEEAGIFAQGAYDLASALGERGHEAYAIEAMAEAAIKAGNETRAEELYGAASQLAAALGMRPLVAHCHLGLGTLYRRTDKREQAQEHLTTATAMYREMGMTYWLEKAEAWVTEQGGR